MSVGINFEWPPWSHECFGRLLPLKLQISAAPSCSDVTPYRFSFHPWSWPCRVFRLSLTSWHELVEHRVWFENAGCGCAHRNRSRDTPSVLQAAIGRYASCVFRLVVLPWRFPLVHYRCVAPVGISARWIKANRGISCWIEQTSNQDSIFRAVSRHCACGVKSSDRMLAAPSNEPLSCSTTPFNLLELADRR